MAPVYYDNREDKFLARTQAFELIRQSNKRDYEAKPSVRYEHSKASVRNGMVISPWVNKDNRNAYLYENQHNGTRQLYE